MIPSPPPAAVDTGAQHPLEGPQRPPSELWLQHVVDVLCTAGGLTPAQRDVLEPLLMGREYREIALILDKSPHTVGVQVKALLRRLGASNSRDLFRVFLCELDRTCELGAGLR